MNIDGLEVRVNRKPIKNLYLRVKPPNGDIEISAPLRMSDKRIAGFVHERHGWIERQRRRMVEDRRRAMNALPGASSGLTSAPSEADGRDRSQVWTEARKRQAAAAINAALPGLLAKWGPVVGRRPTHITLRTMTTRWGSCTPQTGRIRLNLQLGLMEPQFLEYVLVHEMTHLWEHGHGTGFQRRMTVYLPEWKRLRRELNRRVVL